MRSHARSACIYPTLMPCVYVWVDIWIYMRAGISSWAPCLVASNRQLATGGGPSPLYKTPLAGSLIGTPAPAGALRPAMAVAARWEPQRRQQSRPCHPQPQQQPRPRPCHPLAAGRGAAGTGGWAAPHVAPLPMHPWAAPPTTQAPSYSSHLPLPLPTQQQQQQRPRVPRCKYSHRSTPRPQLTLCTRTRSAQSPKTTGGICHAPGFPRSLRQLGPLGPAWRPAPSQQS